MSWPGATRSGPLAMFTPAATSTEDDVTAVSA